MLLLLPMQRTCHALYSLTHTVCADTQGQSANMHDIIVHCYNLSSVESKALPKRCGRTCLAYTVYTKMSSYLQTTDFISFGTVVRVAGATCVSHKH
jgi:hypothetical protein